MNIASTNAATTEQIRNLSANKQLPSGHGGEVLGHKGNANADNINISKFGQANDYISNLPSSEQQEIRSYMNDIKLQKSNGSFDMQASIESAPESIKRLANQLDITTQEVLTLESKQQGKSIVGNSQTSAYTDVMQSNEDNNNSSIFSVISSWFSGDETPAA